mgnify:CR=1 FL=1
MLVAANDTKILENLTPEFLSSKKSLINDAEAIVIDANLSKNTIKYILNNFKNKFIFADPVSITKSLKLKKYLSFINVIKPNLEEAKFLFNLKSISIGDLNALNLSLSKKNTEKIIISLGSKGIISYNNGEILDYLLTRTGYFTSGKLYTEELEIGDEKEKFRTILLEKDNINEIVSIVDSEGDPYYEVEFLSQDTVFKRFPNINISIDTFRGSVAEKAINAGAGIVNDISAFSLDDKMLDVLERYKPTYILMHMKGTPQTMQLKPMYENILTEISSFFIEKISILEKIKLNNIIIDPGFGFGKTISHNYRLVSNLEVFKQLNKPLLIGISRKSMINKVLKIKPLDALNGTTALNMYALCNGANILRVHDVKQANECIKIYKEIQNNK